MTTGDRPRPGLPHAEHLPHAPPAAATPPPRRTCLPFAWFSSIGADVLRRAQRSLPPASSCLLLPPAASCRGKVTSSGLLLGTSAGLPGEAGRRPAWLSLRPRDGQGAAGQPADDHLQGGDPQQ